jgi:outer membrane protein OmpA-like peptidoglycan-associated protein
MVDTSAIRPHMPVIGSDGEHVGTVDGVDSVGTVGTIKLTRNDSTDGQHHYVPLSLVARVDEHVHLSVTRAAALGSAAAAGGADSLPFENRPAQATGPHKSRLLLWIAGAIAIILGLALLKTCADRRQDAAAPPATTAVTTTTTTAALPVETVTLPNGQRVEVAPSTLNYELQAFLASDVAAPRSFVFERLNFATGSAAIREEDRPTIDALAQILTAYPAARVRLDGYADARGTEPANAQLGQQRAAAVADALVAKGVARAAVEAASGGEGNPEATNATATGQAENRRTELTVLAK